MQARERRLQQGLEETQESPNVRRPDLLERRTMVTIGRQSLASQHVVEKLGPPVMTLIGLLPRATPAKAW